ncbi:MAG: trehalose-6-phosphate synthase [Anaerolineaceae bacterium]|nr:trehalose-6-phosphate synthase [Anaerolineaceae bacterium]
MTETEHSMQPEENPLIVIVSNRGPFSFSANDDGSFDVERGAGGLVTALGALAEKHDVLWIAAALSAGDQKWADLHGSEPQNVQGIQLRLIRAENDEQYDQYYNIISNPLLWFIQHQLWDTSRKPSITAEMWEAWQNGYVAMNRLLAQAIADTVKDVNRQIIIFPQDYHLYLVPRYLREELGSRVHIQPFIHIPWPGPDAWRVLPQQMRVALLDSLMQSDRIGFQTKKDAFNFVQTCRFYMDDAHSHGSRDSIHYKGRRVDASAYPISVDAEKVQEMAGQPLTLELEDQIKDFAGGRQLILRTDRVEPSKNILRGLEAFQELLEMHPEHQGKVQMIALLVPSRMEVDEYHSYLQEIMALAGFINAEYSDGYWEPVRILLGDNYQRAIAAMKLYDVLLVNPIADGMNLVAKEGVLVNKNDGVLVLSEYAGAFYELGEDALTVSPFDTYGTAETLHSALVMARDERHKRAENLRDSVLAADVKRWFYQQVDDALRDLSSQEKSASTSETPEVMTSAASPTTSGISGD